MFTTKYPFSPEDTEKRQQAANFQKTIPNWVNNEQKWNPGSVACGLSLQTFTLQGPGGVISAPKMCRACQGNACLSYQTSLLAWNTKSLLISFLAFRVAGRLGSSKTDFPADDQNCEGAGKVLTAHRGALQCLLQGQEETRDKEQPRASCWWSSRAQE